MRAQSILITSAILLIHAACTSQDASTSLARTTPAAEGVRAEGIIGFLSAVAESEHELHSFMFLRHGKVIAEGWWEDRKSVV